MSIMFSVVGVVVLGIGKIRMVPRRMVFILWMIPFLRGVLPIYMSSSISIMNLIFWKFGKTISKQFFKKSVTLSMANYITLADTYKPFQFQSSSVEHIFGGLFVVWMTGMMCLLMTWIVVYHTEKKKISDAQYWKDNIWFSDKHRGAAVYGVIKPQIVVSTIFKECDIEYILQHERMHIKRKDNLWRLLGFGVVAIHWFNPFSWLFLRMFLTDMEMACDEAAIATYDDQERTRYALALVECREKENLFSASFGGSNLKKRIQFITMYRKALFITLCGMWWFMAFIFLSLLTNAQ